MQYQSQHSIIVLLLLFCYSYPYHSFNFPVVLFRYHFYPLICTFSFITFNLYRFIYYLPFCFTFTVIFIPNYIYFIANIFLLSFFISSVQCRLYHHFSQHFHHSFNKIHSYGLWTLRHSQLLNLAFPSLSPTQTFSIHTLAFHSHRFSSLLI